MLSYYHLWRMNPSEARPYKIPREKLLAKDYQKTRCYSQTASLSWHVTGQGRTTASWSVLIALMMRSSIG